MRLWSGTELVFANDYMGPGIMITGDETASSPVPADDWKLDQKKPDGTRIWRPAKATKLDRIPVPCSDTYADVLMRTITHIPPSGVHPGILHGMEKEAKRLYPELDQTVIDLFESFVVYLRANFGLNEASMQTEALETYVDGFGPELLVLLDQKPVVIPELPAVWLAPANWFYANWCVANGMIGPSTEADLPVQERLVFTGDFSKLSLATEGLIYYQAARSMVAWAAWENDPKARFVKAMTSIIMSGYRPVMVTG